MNTNRQTNKFVRFLQNNTALLIIILSVIAIASIVMIVAFTGGSDIDTPVSGQTDDTDDTDTDDADTDDADDTDTDADTNTDTDVDIDTEPSAVQVYFVSPVAEYTVGMGYTDGEEVLFVFNATLNKWSTNYSVNLIAEEGTEVTSMHDGTVVSVSESYALGGTVSVMYGEDIMVTYASLADIVVVEGQSVVQGETIGTVSTTANNEFMEGAHVHVEVAVDGVTVDPTPYIEGTMYIEQTAE